MEFLSPVPDEILQHAPQNADCDGPNQECVILHVVDAAPHDMAELFSPPRLTIHSLLSALDLVKLLIWWTEFIYVPCLVVHWSGRIFVKSHRRRCVVVSPPCITFNSFMGICRGRMPPGRYEQTNLVGENILRNARV